MTNEENDRGTCLLDYTWEASSISEAKDLERSTSKQNDTATLTPFYLHDDLGFADIWFRTKHLAEKHHYNCTYVQLYLNVLGTVCSQNAVICSIYIKQLHLQPWQVKMQVYTCTASMHRDEYIFSLMLRHSCRIYSKKTGQALKGSGPVVDWICNIKILTHQLKPHSTSARTAYCKIARCTWQWGPSIMLTLWTTTWNHWVCLWAPRGYCPVYRQLWRIPETESVVNAAQEGVSWSRRSLEVSHLQHCCQQCWRQSDRWKSCCIKDIHVSEPLPWAWWNLCLHLHSQSTH